MPEGIPPQILEIAERLGRNERLRRRTVESLLKWFGATRRGKVVVTKIREALLSVGLQTNPDFAQCGADDYITFRLIAEGEKAASPRSELDSPEPTRAEPALDGTADAERIHANAPADEPTDDFLEPEFDDEQQAADDDRPVVSKPADWTITSLREKWEGGLLQLQPDFQRQYVWRLKPELPSPTH